MGRACLIGTHGRQGRTDDACMFDTQRQGESSIYVDVSAPFILKWTYQMKPKALPGPTRRRGGRRRDGDGYGGGSRTEARGAGIGITQSVAARCGEAGIGIALSTAAVGKPLVVARGSGDDGGV
uniref:Uncharacterized protein n=1 Tax=Oryza glumipatula TaxID=40148 RepID=A0A0E0ADH0_9ORYZ